MRLGEFELVRRLGSGGMGEVFLARRGGAHVVLKLPLPHLAREPSVVESLSREAEVLSRLRHVCIPRFIERGDVAGTPYICTEYVPGVSLAFLLTKHRLSLGASLRILADVAQALTHAHLARTTDGRSLSLVHRDVSPSNMIVGFDGITRLIDFGIAKTAVSLVTTAGVARGKPRYMSPEQITSEPLDARSDIFSAGVVLYELLTHEPPFDASSEFHLMDAILHHEPALPSARGGPPDLDAVIMRALSKRREDRFQTAAEFERELLKRLASLNRGNDHHAVRAFAEAWRRDPLPTPQANPTKRPAMVETKRIEKPVAARHLHPRRHDRVIDHARVACHRRRDHQCEPSLLVGRHSFDAFSRPRQVGRQRLLAGDRLGDNFSQSTDVHRVAPIARVAAVRAGRSRIVELRLSPRAVRASSRVGHILARRAAGVAFERATEARGRSVAELCCDFANGIPADQKQLLGRVRLRVVSQIAEADAFGGEPPLQCARARLIVLGDFLEQSRTIRALTRVAHGAEKCTVRTRRSLPARRDPRGRHRPATARILLEPRMRSHAASRTASHTIRSAKAHVVCEPTEAHSLRSRKQPNGMSF